MNEERLPKTTVTIRQYFWLLLKEWWTLFLPRSKANISTVIGAATLGFVTYKITGQLSDFITPVAAGVLTALATLVGAAPFIFIIAGRDLYQREQQRANVLQFEVDSLPTDGPHIVLTKTSDRSAPFAFTNSGERDAMEIVVLPVHFGYGFGWDFPKIELIKRDSPPMIIPPRLSAPATYNPQPLGWSDVLYGLAGLGEEQPIKQVVAIFYQDSNWNLYRTDYLCTWTERLKSLHLLLLNYQCLGKRPRVPKEGLFYYADQFKYLDSKPEEEEEGFSHGSDLTA